MKRYEQAARRDKVIEMVRLGRDTRSIAADLGIEPEYVRMLARAAGLRLRAPYDSNYKRPPALPSAEKLARTNEMAELYRNGQTLEQIGVKFDMSRERVRQILHGTISSEQGGSSVRKARRLANLAKNFAARIQEKFGITVEQHRVLTKNGVRRRYNQQRRSARDRGIEWEITAWDWWEVWRDSGHWEQRGRHKEDYVMCRFGDVGPYSKNNVFIATASENCSAGQRRRKANPTKSANPKDSQ